MHDFQTKRQPSTDRILKDHATWKYMMKLSVNLKGIYVYHHIDFNNPPFKNFMKTELKHG